MHQRSLPNWLPQAKVRSTGHQLVAWIGAGVPLWAIWPWRSRSARVARVVSLLWAASKATVMSVGSGPSVLRVARAASRVGASSGESWRLALAGH